MASGAPSGRGLDDSTTELQSTISRLTLEKKGLAEKVSLLEGKLQSSNEMGATLRDRIQKRDSEILSLQKENSGHKINASSSVLAASGVDQALFGTLKSQIPQYQAEIQSLKEKNHSLQQKVDFLTALKENVEKVKEEKIALEFQLSSHDALVKKNALLELQLENQAAEKKEWTKYLELNGKTLAVDSPFAMAQALSKAVAKVSALTSTIDSLKEYERSFHETQMRSLEKNKELENHVDRLKRESESLKTQLYRANMENNLLGKEKSMLRDSLSSFDQEQQQMNPTHFDKVRVLRIKQLEELVEEWSSKFTTLSSEFDAKITTYTATIEELQRNVDELEEKVGEGLYNPITTRVLQLDSNPSIDSLQTKLKQLDSLLAENVKLREQVTTGNSVGHIPLETFQTLENDLERLRRELNSKDTSIARLKQVFQAQIGAFRRFVHEGLGFNVDMQNDTQYRVSVGKGFTFKVGDGTISAVGSIHPQYQHIDVKSIFHEWIEQRKSMPGFFSALVQILSKSSEN